MRGLAIMLLALGFGMASDVVTAVAQHHAAKQKASRASDLFAGQSTLDRQR